ncbi:MAG: PilZ domain-containing protein [Acidobacteriota bacterium]|nr:PilZ domain-containing protein [Acidobacteriota bacterium]
MKSLANGKQLHLDTPSVHSNKNSPVNGNGNASGAGGVNINVMRSTASAARPAMMRPPTSEERRRAQRVLLRMPILLHVAGKPKALEAETHTVSQNGAMILVAESLLEGTKISIENPSTEKRVEARVVRAPQLSQGGLLVPVEFVAPSPLFWGIFFPPALA